MMHGFIQKVNPFTSSSKCSSPSESGRKSSLVDINGDNNPTEPKPSGNNLLSSQNTDKYVQESDSEATMLPSAQWHCQGERMGTTKEEISPSGRVTEPGPTDMSGFKWDHFKKDSAEDGEILFEASSEASPLQTDEDGDRLLAWWRNVEGWTEWNMGTEFGGDNADQTIEAAADRVFKAARLFIYLFDQREASLYMRVVELLAVADAADSFHKKTVTASIGGGVASVAGGITTITGLALAPFTFGSSLIVTAVGIGVGTAGGITSATANITDTVHSRTDRSKVEQVILGFQEEIKDIRECLQFLQTGMETLEECNFQQYMDSISKSAMNKSVKHVMKEGGRAGKALLINAESLASTVQVLSSARGVAKATQVLTIASGVMSGLFLALDVFFLARDSRELHKGAKTKFAAKIKDVCKELLDGLIELKSIKEQLQTIIINAEEDEGDDDEYEE